MTPAEEMAPLLPEKHRTTLEQMADIELDQHAMVSVQRGILRLMLRALEAAGAENDAQRRARAQVEAENWF